MLKSSIWISRERNAICQWEMGQKIKLKNKTKQNTTILEKRKGDFFVLHDTLIILVSKSHEE